MNPDQIAAAGHNTISAIPSSMKYIIREYSVRWWPAILINNSLAGEFPGRSRQGGGQRHSVTYEASSVFPGVLSGGACGR